MIAYRGLQQSPAWASDIKEPPDYSQEKALWHLNVTIGNPLISIRN